jgi:hypothetical protein
LILKALLSNPHKNNSAASMMYEYPVFIFGLIIIAVNFQATNLIGILLTILKAYHEQTSFCFQTIFYVVTC